MSGQRCLVPSTGFYEWRDEVPYFFHLKDRGLFSMAGLFVARTNGP